jgi:hypothetical protein
MAPNYRSYRKVSRERIERESWPKCRGCGTPTRSLSPHGVCDLCELTCQGQEDNGGRVGNPYAAFGFGVTDC